MSKFPWKIQRNKTEAEVC